jgi:hypothetical protein
MDLSRKHLALSTILRSALIVGLVLALMQPVLYKASSAISTVYLLDVSNSVQPGSIKGAIEWITATNNAGRSDHAQFAAFGSNSMAFDSVEELRKSGLPAIGETDPSIKARPTSQGAGSRTPSSPENLARCPDSDL